MRRFGALIVTGGTLLSATIASAHDPWCPHHGEAPLEHASRAVPGHGGHEIDDTSHDQESKDCRCSGGLCALGATPDPVLHASSPQGMAADRAPVFPAELLAVSERSARSTIRRQPPGTGPPIAI